MHTVKTQELNPFSCRRPGSPVSLLASESLTSKLLQGKRAIEPVQLTNLPFASSCHQIRHTVHVVCIFTGLLTVGAETHCPPIAFVRAFATFSGRPGLDIFHDKVRHRTLSSVVVNLLERVVPSRPCECQSKLASLFVHLIHHGESVLTQYVRTQLVDSVEDG